MSLDQLLDEHDPDSDLYDLLVAPAFLSTAPQPNAQKRAQVDTLLAYLSPRAQAVLRLRYSLSYANDERPRSISEIARPGVVGGQARPVHPKRCMLSR